MGVTVRAARTADSGAPQLLYASAQPYYDAFFGSPRRAQKLLESLWLRPGHTASFQACRVAELDGALAGAMVAFPAQEGDRLAQRFLSASLTRMPPWRWLAVARHLRASAGVVAPPPARSLYVDALATDPEVRRRGVATALLQEAEALAAARGLRGISLDTGLANTAAQALYEHCGFQCTGERWAPDERTAEAIGGPGFVSYFKPL